MRCVYRNFLKPYTIASKTRWISLPHKLSNQMCLVEQRENLNFKKIDEKNSMRGCIFENGNPV